jgi:hypothetical protein
MNVTMMIETMDVHMLVIKIRPIPYTLLLVRATSTQSIRSQSMRSGYNHNFVHHLDAVNFPLCFLCQAVSTVQCRASDGFCVFVEARIAFGVLVATGERLLAIDAASGMCVPASSGVCGVGLTVARKGVDERIGVLARTFRFLL